VNPAINGTKKSGVSSHKLELKKAVYPAINWNLKKLRIRGYTSNLYIFWEKMEEYIWY
jgi:hypothetical protein